MAARGDGPLRVAFLAGTLGTGGAERQLLLSARGLSARGVAVSVLTLGAGEVHEETLSAARVPVTRVPRTGGRAGRLVSVTRAVRALAPHVVQAVHTYTGLAAAAAARLSGAASLGALRGSLAGSRRANGVLARFHLRAPDGVVTNAESAALELRAARGLTPRRLWVVPNAVELPPEPSARPPGPPVALFVGRLVKAKRVELFLEALALARRRVPELTGRVVGEGPERAAAEERARELGLLPSGVEFLGLRHDVPRLLASADLLLLASAEEGFPNVVLEAMAASLPVVSTPAGDAPLVVRHGETGFVERDADGLAGRLALLAADPALRACLGAAGRRRVAAEYGVEKLAANLLAVYGELLEGRSRVVRALAVG